jgi:hypothetical protein
VGDDTTLEKLKEIIRHRVDGLYADPDFAGVIFQHWHCSSDERLPNGDPAFEPRNVGEDFVERQMLRAELSDGWFSVRPVFFKEGEF